MKVPTFLVVVILTIGSIFAQALAPAEPLGPASRRTGLVISEIFYNSLSSYPDTFPNEFIEIYNSNPFFEDVSGLRIVGNIDYTFPPGTRIEGNAFLVLRPPQYSGTLGDLEGLRLLEKSGAILAEVYYGNQYTSRHDWPAAEGTGHSIVLKRPSYGQNNPKAWGLSDQRGGSPGGPEPVVVRASDAVRLNEFRFPEIELYNHSNVEVDLSGHIISSRFDNFVNDTVLPQGTMISPRGFLLVSVSALFGTVYLRTPDGNHIIDAVRGNDPGGRYPDGGEWFSALSCTSMGQPNCRPTRLQVVINEIMYAPISGNDDDEYIELYNRGPGELNVTGWAIAADTFSYIVPRGTMLGASNYLVVAKNPERMLSRYPYLTSANVIGGFPNSLPDDGGRIVLVPRDDHVVDEVTYGVGGQWGEWSRGGGSSLELRDPHSDGRYAHNWADSDESGKGIWTTIEGTAALGETMGTANDQVFLALLGAGECLVDEVEVRNGHGSLPNFCVNGGFESGLSGWFPMGSHDHSIISQESFAGTKALRLRAATAGDTGPSRVRSGPLVSRAVGEVLLRARVKWLRGSPEIALRLHGGGLDASGRMQIQPNGTPGLRNSRAVDNAGPAIFDVSHDPPLPAADETVRVSASVSDPDGISALILNFRIESGPSDTLGMVDDGTGGDLVAGDGVYSAAIKGRAAGVRVGFFIQAIDTAGATNTFPQEVFPKAPYDRVFPTDAYNRECVVRWGETNVAGAFGSYHLWLNASNTARWTDRRPVLNDTPLDGTFVYNNSRVIYNVRPAYHSSPWHRGQRTTGPDGNQAIDFSVQFPPDNTFMGATEALWIHPGNPNAGSSIYSTDDSAQAESAANMILKAFGLQGNYQRYVHVFVNGSRRSLHLNRPFIMQDAQRPNVDMMQQWSPGDPGGDLLWLEDWMEYPEDGDNFVEYNDADLTRREIALYPTGQAFHMGAYRYMFRPSDSRPGKSANNYTTLFALLNQVTPTNDAPIRLSAIDLVLDYQQWMRMLAAQHTFGNWDTYGYRRGRNAYIYRNSTGRAQLWAWKNNFSLALGGDGPMADVFDTTDPRITEMWNEPTILRTFWQAFYEIIRGPFDNALMNPILDARVAALRANGVTIQESTVTNIKNYIQNRRQYLAGRLGAATNAAVTAVAISTNNNVLTLRGSAPIQVSTILVNGRPYPVTWSLVTTNLLLGRPAPTNWTATVVLEPGVNSFAIVCQDSRSNVIGSPLTVQAEYIGPVADPRENVMITEIMYRPPQAGADYVELFNKSRTLSFNLQGWSLEGVGFSFPPGAILGPDQFITLTADPLAVVSTFQVPGNIYRYSYNLDAAAQTLSLVLPNDDMIDRVRYESVPPWPQGANGGGSALQVIDVNEDNSRVSNWTDGFGWRYATYTGTILGGSARGTNFYIFLNSPGTIYIDDISLVSGTVAEVGPNMLQNGGFQAPLDNTWTTHGNHSTSMRTTESGHNGGASLKLVSTGIGGQGGNYVRQYIPGNESSGVFTLSFWYRLDMTGDDAVLTTRTSPGSEFIFGTDISSQLSATPGQSNSAPVDLPPYDPIWLNEISVGNADPWFEIYNAGTNTVSLSGYSLLGISGLGEYHLDDQPNVAPGEFRVIPLPGQPGIGSYALWRKVGTHNLIVDYFNFDSPFYGAVPDGQPFWRGPLRYPTRALSNLSPRVKSIQRFPGITYLVFEVVPDYRYYVEYKDNLSDPAWLSFGGGYLDAHDPEIQFSDTTPSAGQRFYRLTLVNAIE